MVALPRHYSGPRLANDHPDRCFALTECPGQLTGGNTTTWDGLGQILSKSCRWGAEEHLFGRLGAAVQPGGGAKIWPQSPWKSKCSIKARPWLINPVIVW